MYGDIKNAFASYHIWWLKLNWQLISWKHAAKNLCISSFMESGIYLRLNFHINIKLSLLFLCCNADELCKASDDDVMQRYALRFNYYFNIY